MFSRLEKKGEVKKHVHAPHDSYAEYKEAIDIMKTQIEQGTETIEEVLESATQGYEISVHVLNLTFIPLFIPDKKLSSNQSLWFFFQAFG